ncbi:MAG: hypothetical protein ACOC8E_00375 [Planctomycetota bacterium]
MTNAADKPIPTAADPARLCELAQSHPRPEGAPERSDVSMRLFRKREDDAEIEAGKAFHITRGDWSYILDADYIRKVKKLGWSFQGTMNGVTRNAEHAMKDKDGKPRLDHFKKPGRYWADMRNEAYRKWYVDRLVAWVEAGADSIQRDEPTTCKRTPIPVAAKFFQDVHERFRKRVGERVPMSCNLAWNRSRFGGRGRPVAKQFDFGMAEFYRKHLKPETLMSAAQDAERRGKALIYTGGAHMSRQEVRLAIAGCYANGMNYIVPWDQFTGVGKPRLFGEPEDFADLYGFVRAVAGYLDGYEAAASWIPAALREKEAGQKLPGGRRAAADDSPFFVPPGTGRGRLCIFARARPDRADAPVVLHLVEWGGQPKPATLALRPEAFFGDRELRVALLTPPPYDQAAHEKAEAEKNYTPLATRAKLEVTPTDGLARVSVPALRPWGILIVSPAARDE